jgi:hypothetical protein
LVQRVVIVHGPEWNILVGGYDIFEPPPSNVLNYVYDHSVFLNSNPDDATLETGRELLERVEEAISDDVCLQLTSTLSPRFITSVTEPTAESR